MSGSSPSLEKSCIFFSGVGNSVKRDILDILGFKEGVLPVWYLRVPLITSRLKYSDCIPLIERITNRVKVWTNRALYPTILVMVRISSCGMIIGILIALFLIALGITFGMIVD